LRGAQESFLVAALAQDRRYGLHLLIAGGKEEAAYRYNDLQGLLGTLDVCFFPDSFKSPMAYELLNATQILQRSEVVNKMTLPDPPKVIVTYPEALFEKVVRPDVLVKNRIDLQKGEKLDVDWMIEVLVEYHFERVDFVFEPGQFSVRGGIIDLFSYSNDLPYRIELFDDEVESIRIFDPLTQLSQQHLDRLSIVPNLNTRFQQSEKVSLLDILPMPALVWLKDEEILIEKLQKCFEKAEQYGEKLTFLDDAELREIFRDRAFLKYFRKLALRFRSRFLGGGFIVS
jgi:transcription-repair coupling factor (superfamily II helicase)